MAWYDAPNAFYSKQRKKKELLYRQATVIARTTVLGRSDKCTYEEGKWCCITYGTNGQHHNIEWCNNIVDHGVNNNSYGTQDITILKYACISWWLGGKGQHTCYREPPQAYMAITCQDGPFACMESKDAKERKGNATGASCEGLSAKVHHPATVQVQ